MKLKSISHLDLVKSSNSFEEYAVLLNRRILRTFAIVSGIFVPLMMPLDLLMTQSFPEFVPRLQLWRIGYPLFILALAFATATIATRRNQIIVAVLFFSGGVSTSAAIFAPAGGFDVPWIYGSIGLPMLTIAFLMHWMIRILTTILLPVIFLGVYIAYDPGLIADPRFFDTAVINGYSIAVSITLGYTWETMNWLFFENSQRLTSQTRKLRNLNTNLQNEVARQTTNIQNIAASRTARLESEKSRIARDLHDELGQDFASLKMELHVLKTSMSTSTSIASINTLQSLASAMIGSIRQLIEELSPDWILEKGLEISLASSIDTLKLVADNDGVIARCAVDDSASRLEKGLTLGIFRIANEVLAQIFQNDTLSRVQVRVTANDQTCKLAIVEYCQRSPARKFDSGAILERLRTFSGTADTQFHNNGRRFYASFVLADRESL